MGVNEMKKIIYNDIRGFITIILLMIPLIFTLVLGAQSATQLGFICASCLFVFGLCLWLVAFLLNFELILIKEDKIVSIKINKHTEIFYNEIVSIRSVDNKHGIGIGGVSPVWEITSSTKKTIWFIQEKSRKKIINEIQQRTNIDILK